MLVSFSLDPDALHCNREDLSISIANHRRIIAEWRKHGMLVHSHGALKESALIKAVEDLPQECRKLWKTAFSYNRRRPSTTEWDGSFPNASLEDLSPLSSEFVLALLESTRAVVVGRLGENQSSRFEPLLGGMELCKAHAVSESAVFQQADQLSMNPLPPGASCGTEWASRYTGYLKQADNVTVVDRYILANHERRRNRGEVSGLNRLLSDCFARPRNAPITIKVICAVQNKNFPLLPNEAKLLQDFVHDLAIRYSGGGIRSLECFVLEDEKFAKHCHSRYFRADYAVFGIDSGLDAFGGATSSRGCVVWRNDTAMEPYFSTQEAELQGSAFSIDRAV